MRTVIAACSLALGACGAHVREFLPRTGHYLMEIQAPDGGKVLDQAVAVVSAEDQVAIIYLPDQSGLPPACAWASEAVHCERVLSGLVLGKLLTCHEDAILSASGEVVLRGPLRPGASFDVFDDGTCRLTKTVEEVSRGELKLLNTRVCGTTTFSRGFEVWRRRSGLVRLQVEDGTVSQLGRVE